MMQKRVKKPRKIRIEYVDRDRKFRREYVKTSDKFTPMPAPTLDYHPTTVLGICVRCKTLGNVEFPAKFSYKFGDNAMNRRQFECFCLKCGRNSEFLPVPEDKAGIEVANWVKRVEEKLLEKEIKNG